jgi:hypothetical protein
MAMATKNTATMTTVMMAMTTMTKTEMMTLTIMSTTLRKTMTMAIRTTIMTTTKTTKTMMDNNSMICLSLYWPISIFRLPFALSELSNFDAFYLTNLLG